MTPEYEWAGHLCLSQNGVSVTGEVDGGLFSACVQNGLGTARGTLTGIAAAVRCDVRDQRLFRAGSAAKHPAAKADPRHRRECCDPMEGMARAV